MQVFETTGFPGLGISQGNLQASQSTLVPNPSTTYGMYFYLSMAPFCYSFYLFIWCLQVFAVGQWQPILDLGHSEI